MTISLLPPDQYSRLPIEINPATSVVVVAEDEQTHEIKGYWAAQSVVHVEPVWLHEDLRSGRDGLKMYAALLAGLHQAGVKGFYAFADRDEIATYIERLGLKVKPWIIYEGQVPEIPAQEKIECLQQS